MGVECEERRGTLSKSPLLRQIQRAKLGVIEEYESKAEALVGLVARLKQASGLKWHGSCKEWTHIMDRSVNQSFGG
jgi:hypothetical protein